MKTREPPPMKIKQVTLNKRGRFDDFSDNCLYFFKQGNNILPSYRIKYYRNEFQGNF
jgi:hypothetical protein